MKQLANQDVFYQKVFRMVPPIVLQNLLSAAVSSADVVMLNYVGQSSISAVSLASQYTSVLFMVFFGTGTGAGMLCAQYYGKKDFRALQLIEGISMRFALAVSFVFAGLVLTVPEQMMRIFTEDGELIALGASYLRLLSVCYVCWAISEVYLSVLRSMGKVVISTSLNVLAFTLNIILNAVFIFGLFGAPKLGIVGVAIATSTSRFVQLLGCFAVSFFQKEVKLDFRYMFVRNKALFSDFVRLSLPALGDDVCWSLAFSMYSVILGHLGTDVVAANSFVTVIRNFGTVLCFGMASASSILVGNLIGENKMDEAQEGARKAMKLTVVTGAIGGLFVLAAIPFVMKHAALTGQAMHYLKYMMLINAYYIMGAAVNTTLIAGVFRAGGDSRFSFVCDVVDMWCYAVPLGFFAAFVLKLPVMWVYFLICTDEFVKWPWVLRHYRSGKWLHNITREDLFSA